jgi:hypothetical protein
LFISRRFTDFVNNVLFAFIAVRFFLMASSPMRIAESASLTDVGPNFSPNRPHFRPHISATPRDQTDEKQHLSLKTRDMRDETDMQQPSDSSF